MADQMKVRYLGDIPIDPAIVQTSDEGVPFIKQYAESRTAEAFQRVVQSLFISEERKTS
jgi:MinD-like ATPase involved in chromosome partitioning or flagellar assembly